MIKRLTAALAATVLVLVCATGALASASSVSISGAPGKAPVSFQYSETNGEIVKSVKHLISDLNKLTGKKSITESLTVQSISAEGKSVTFALRLSLPQSAALSSGPEKVTPSPSPDDDNVLDYYNIMITDSDGDTVYDYHNAGKTSGDAQYKDIALNTMNLSVPSEREVYKITVSANSDLAKLSSSASRIDWSIVVNGDSEYIQTSSDTSDIVSEVSVGSFEASATETASPSELPSAELILPADTVPTDVEQTEPPSETPIPQSGAKVILERGQYTVGNGLVAGRYQITGDSTVKVYTAQGDLKTNIILTTDKESHEGVESYVLTVRDGEIVDVTAETTFEEYIPARVTPNPSPTTSSRATARPTTSTGSTSKTTTASKSNPQTGDNAPIALAAVIGAAALAICAVLEIYKRKNR